MPAAKLREIFVIAQDNFGLMPCHLLDEFCIERNSGICKTAKLKLKQNGNQSYTNEDNSMPS